jgi:hypothetical protein
MDLNRYLRNQWDRAAAVVAVLLGALALLSGYLGVSRATLATQQIPYLASGGLFGMFALGIGATLWLSADLRDEWRKLDSIQEEMRIARPEAVDPAPATNGRPRTARRDVITPR